MRIKDIMTPEPLATRFDATIQEAAAGMQQANVGALPVVSDRDQLIGILTDRDLVTRALAEGLEPETPVERVMTRGATSVEAADEIEDALALMRQQQVRRLPVVEGGKLVGIVAQADLAAVCPPPVFTAVIREISEPAAVDAARRAAGERSGISGLPT